MKRRLIKQGASTLTVSVPQQWAVENKLRPGSAVDLFPQGSTLKISASACTLVKSLSIDLSDSPAESVPLLVRSLYAAGYQKIKITYSNQEILDSVQSSAQSLLGIVVSVKDDSCIINQIGSFTSKEFESIFSEVLNSVARVLLDSSRSSESKSSSPDIGGRCLLTQNYAIYCIRMLNQGLHAQDSITYGSLLNSFISLAHSLPIYLTSALKKGLSKNVSQILAKLSELIETLAVLVHSPGSARQVAALISGFQDIVARLETGSEKSDEMLLLSSIASFTGSLQTYAAILMIEVNPDE